MIKTVLTLTTLALLAGPASAATSYAGTWAGGPATCATPFRLSAKEFSHPSGKSQRVARVDRTGNWYVIDLADGNQLGLFDVRAKTMTLHLKFSGETFDLTRCR